MHIDHSVYPDLDHPPDVLETDYDKADYVHRVCTAWDHGVPPDHETFELFRGWKEIFDRFPIETSPAYHAMRAWFDWAPVDIPPGLHAPAPPWLHMDRLEGRPDDPCENMI